MVLTHRYNRPTYLTRAKSSPDGWNDWATECRGDRQLAVGPWYVSIWLIDCMDGSM